MSNVRQIRTSTERALAASVTLATVRNALLDLARDAEDAGLSVIADRVRGIDWQVRRFGEQARELAKGKP